jgi:hypothetical protein
MHCGTYLRVVVLHFLAVQWNQLTATGIMAALVMP